MYRSIFFYGVCRMIAWTSWAHLVARPIVDGVSRIGYPFDLSWTGPYWIPALSLHHVNPWLAYPVAIGLFAARLPRGRQVVGPDGPRRAAPSRQRARPNPEPIPVAVSERTEGVDRWLIAR